MYWHIRGLVPALASPCLERTFINIGDSNAYRNQRFLGNRIQGLERRGGLGTMIGRVPVRKERVPLCVGAAHAASGCVAVSEVSSSEAAWRRSHQQEVAFVARHGLDWKVGVVVAVEQAEVEVLA